MSLVADTLATLARLRSLQATQARRDLAEALRAQAEVEAALNAAWQARQTEAQAACTDPGSQHAFAGWLPRSDADLARLVNAAAKSGQEQQSALAGLAACKGALEAVETLQRERAAEARKAGGRRLQLRLDELGVRR